MGIRSLISGFSLAALVTTGAAVPTVANAGDVKIHLHGHFIAGAYGYKHHYGHRHGPRRHYGHRHFFPRHRYGHPYWYGRKHYYGHPSWYGRKRHYGRRWYGEHRYHNPRFDRGHGKHHQRPARRGFSDVVNPQPRRKRH